MSRSSSPSSRRRPAAVLAAATLLCAPGVAQAYIGPGAGFALGGSFLFALAGLLVALGAMFLWPLRFVGRRWRGRKRRGRARAKRVIVVGLDGIDPQLCRDFMARGLLPNLQRLAGTGGFRELATTLPPMSPVGWSTFATGTDAGRHAIFDFLSRDTRTHLPVLSSTRITEGAPRRLGPLKLGRGKPRIELLRRSKPFWRSLAEQGVPSTILRVPITFPPDNYPGRMLSAMCVPDLRGTQGSFTHYTVPGGRDPQAPTGGTRLEFAPAGPDAWTAELPGPDLPDRDGTVRTASIGFAVQVDAAARRAHFEVGESTFTLGPDEYSAWIPLAFGRRGARAHGIARFRVTSFAPLAVYVTPINLDPAKPDMPISHPPHLAIALARLQGRFATLGLAEDTWALNERAIDERAFLEQAYLIHEERRRQFLHAVDRQPEGAVAVVFDATDRIQHMFWRYRVPGHPANRVLPDEGHADAIEKIYRAGDDIVGEVLERCGKNDVVLVISDHGFADFRRGVNLNTWFREHGYLFLEDDPADGPPPPLPAGSRVEPSAIDWARTRAYTNGLAGFYLNVAGRERNGCVPPDEAADLLHEIIGKLRGLPDPAGGTAIADVWAAGEAYDGPYAGDGPDAVVGYNRGYRADWHAALGRLTGSAVRDNTRSWSGDHCMDPAQVPGVVFANRPLDRDDCALVDMAPTILDLFGIDRPAHMQGRSLFEET